MISYLEIPIADGNFLLNHNLMNLYNFISGYPFFHVVLTYNNINNPEDTKIYYLNKWVRQDSIRDEFELIDFSKSSKNYLKSFKYGTMFTEGNNYILS